MERSYLKIGEDNMVYDIETDVAHMTNGPLLSNPERINKAGSHNTPTTLNVGRKDDKGKLRADLLPVDALLKVAEVLTYGADHYEDRNWEKGIEFSRVYGALLRHLFAWHTHHTIDQESRLLHLAHAATDALFLLHYALDDAYNEFDDRPKPMNGGV